MSSPHQLRLAQASGDDHDGWAALQQARLAVIKENRLAAHAVGLQPGDPRLLLAAQTRAKLQGALLTPEHRNELLSAGRRMGMRSFDSSLVIAVVQDEARMVQSCPPMVETATASGGMARAAQDDDDAAWTRWFAAFAAALAVAAALMRWIAG